jgi:hypothetical protein
MTELQQEPLRWFVQQLTPAAVNVFWSSKRHAAAADTREPFYGARFSRHPLPAAWLQRIQQCTAADVAGRGGKHPHTTEQQQQQQQGMWQAVPDELHLPPANWAIPQDFALRQQGDEAAAADGSAAPDDQAPTLLMEQPGLSVWHRLDTSFGLPKVCETCAKLWPAVTGARHTPRHAHSSLTHTHARPAQVHLKLHLVTPAVYASPAATVSARLLVAVLQDLLLPLTYPAELAGSYVGLSTGPGGLSLKCAGFQGVAQQLVMEVLRALQGGRVAGAVPSSGVGPFGGAIAGCSARGRMTDNDTPCAALSGLHLVQVEARFATMAGRLQQSLTNWSNNNPVSHRCDVSVWLLLSCAAAKQPSCHCPACMLLLCCCHCVCVCVCVAVSTRHTTCCWSSTTTTATCWLRSPLSAPQT